MPWSAAHRGIDIRATANQVVAPHPGEVTFIGVVVDRPVVTIRHPNGLLSSFEPVESDLAVGDAVSRGATIGHISADAQHCEVGCASRSEEHTSELQSRGHLVCRALLDKQNKVTMSAGAV